MLIRLSVADHVSSPLPFFFFFLTDAQRYLFRVVCQNNVILILSDFATLKSIFDTLMKSPCLSFVVFLLSKEKKNELTTDTRIRK